MSEQIQENKMGVMPIGKLLINMSLPMMIVMLVQAFYNVVDSYFVAKLSQDALNAVSLAFPIQNLMTAVSVGTCVGVNAYLSRSLGEKEYDSANAAAGNGIFLALMGCAVFMLVGATVVRPFYLAQTDIEGIVEQGVQYLSICCLGSIGAFVGMVFDRLLQSTGRNVFTMATQGVGAVTNIILDPILIFGLGPFPAMGVAGAALATVGGQIVGAIMSVIINLKFNKDIDFKFHYLKPRLHVIQRIYAIGVPSIVMNSIGSVMVFCLNQILIAFTSTATAVFGIYYKLQSFVFMPIFGLNNGLVSIIAYNFGARRPDRIKEAQKKGLIIATCIMVCGMAVAQLFPETLLGMFEASDEMLSIGCIALRIISLSFVFAGINIISSSTLQALGHGVLSMIVSIVRQLVVLIPVAFLLSRTGELDLVWWSFPVSEVVATAMSIYYVRRTQREVIDTL